MCLAGKQHAQVFYLRLVDKDRLALAERAHLGIKAAHHRIDALAAYILEKLNIFKVHFIAPSR